MATKTISIDMEAYGRLRAARLRLGESFSQVIKRGDWPKVPSTGARLLKALESAPLLSDEEIDGLNAVQDSDTSPDDSWSR